MEDFKKIYLPVSLVCCAIFALFYVGVSLGWFDGEKPKISNSPTEMYSTDDYVEEVEMACEESACEESACEEAFCDVQDVEVIEESCEY